MAEQKGPQQRGEGAVVVHRGTWDTRYDISLTPSSVKQAQRTGFEGSQEQDLANVDVVIFQPWLPVREKGYHRVARFCKGSASLVFVLKKYKGNPLPPYFSSTRCRPCYLDANKMERAVTKKER